MARLKEIVVKCKRCLLVSVGEHCERTSAPSLSVGLLFFFFFLQAILDRKLVGRLRPGLGRVLVARA
jgi:hypothetical protein